MRTKSNKRSELEAIAPAKSYYSPPFSQLAAVSIKRLSWSMRKPMSAAVDLMVRLLPSMVQSAKICMDCKDNTKCQACIFSAQTAEKEAAAFLASL